MAKSHPLFRQVGPTLSGNLGGKAGLGDSHRERGWTVPRVKGPFLTEPSPPKKKPQVTPFSGPMPVRNRNVDVKRPKTRMEPAWGRPTGGPVTETDSTRYHVPRSPRPRTRKV